ncbi:hypothetical protein ACIBKY_39380 [Nonomuraea sp. NPDC050394]|uniref:hypothetical protein n=1 Tax=Nonomuraea sp. NPDC050394 TaxID=3364363 RepID=UPI003799C138
MDDLDARFQELVSQIGEDEQRRMREAAAKAARRAAPPSSRRPSSRARRWALAVVLVLAVLVAAASVLAFRPELLTPEPAVRRTQPAPTSTPEPPAPADPFEGSPATGYASGAAGFVLPAPKAVGGLSAKEVGRGLARVRDLLTAAYLDPATLMGGEPKAFTALADPGQRKKITRSWVNSFAPGTTELATDVIKVRGEATLSRLREGARVKVSYLVVYAVQSPGRPDQVVRLVTRPRGSFAIYVSEGEVRVWVERLGADATPVRCDVSGGYIHPRFPGSAPGRVSGTGAPRDPYDLHQPVSDGCTATTGT